MTQRILIIGCCGSGKSTLARQLHQLTSLPLIHLDQEYWQPNWVEPTKAEWEDTVRGLIKRPAWIMDGNYGGTMEMRMQRADTIIYLDRPTWLCLFRVLKRIIRHHGRVRPDMPAGCRERWDWDFLHYVATFKLVKRSSILKRIDQYSPNRSVYQLRNNREVQELLSKISAAQRSG
jgi:adenylate kinase family enzyme